MCVSTVYSVLTEFCEKQITSLLLRWDSKPTTFTILEQCFALLYNLFFFISVGGTLTISYKAYFTADTVTNLIGQSMTRATIATWHSMPTQEITTEV